MKVREIRMSKKHKFLEVKKKGERSMDGLDKRHRAEDTDYRREEKNTRKRGFDEETECGRTAMESKTGGGFGRRMRAPSVKSTQSLPGMGGLGQKTHLLGWWIQAFQ